MADNVPALAGFETLPAHLRGYKGPLAKTNEQAKVAMGMPQPPRISTRGKVFRLVLDGQEKPLMQKNEDGDMVPVPGINVVVVATNKGKYKTYFGDRKYNDDESAPPICYSFDGETPSPHAEQPQSASCATCKHNVFGSKITDQGNKTRACADNKLIAVLEAGAVTKQLDRETNILANAFRFKIPTTGLNRSREDRKKNPNRRDTSWMEMLEVLDHYPAGALSVSTIVTRITFDNEADYPLPRFRPVRPLTEEELAFVEARVNDPDVIEAVTEQGGTAPAKGDDEEFESPPPKAALPPPQPAKAAPKPSPKPPAEESVVVGGDEEKPKRGRPAKAKPAQAADDGVVLGGDDEPPARAAAPAKSSRDVVDDQTVQEIENFFGASN